MYVVPADAKEFAGIVGDDIDPNIDIVVSNVIGMAQEWLNASVGTTWEAVTATKLFDYSDAETLKLDSDLYSLTSITNGDGTSIASGDVFLYPRSGPPYRRIERKGSANWAVTHPALEKRSAITVVGSWGRALSASKEVQTVTCILVTQVLNEAREAGVQAVNAEFANTSFDRKIHPMVEAFIKRYRRPRAA